MMALRIIYLGILLLFSCFDITSQSNQEQKAPNILMILVDDLGYGDLSCQGGTDILTPNIDNIAKKGMTFTNFYANSTVCSPSRASLLSGQYPDMVGVPGVIRQVESDNWGYLLEETTLMPLVFKKLGYQTAMVGKWHLGYEKPNTPNEKGFDHFHGFLGDMMDDYYTHLRGGVNWMRLNENEIFPDGHATDVFTDWTIDYLDEKKIANQPFFLYLAYNAPHFPIQPPQEYLDNVIKRDPNINLNRAKNVALIEHLDYNVGRILQKLKDTDLDENTLIVFASDNGGSLRHAQSNGNLRGGKQDMYEGGIKVPAFFMWKNKIAAGSNTNNFGILMDLFPTFCEVAGMESSLKMDGISLLPTLLGEKQVTDDRFVFWIRREGGGYGGQAYYAARYKEFKILQNTPFEEIQYFDLKNDKLEAKGLEFTDNDIFQKLRNELREHIRMAGAVPWQK